MSFVLGSLVCPLQKCSNALYVKKYAPVDWFSYRRADSSSDRFAPLSQERNEEKSSAHLEYCRSRDCTAIQRVYLSAHGPREGDRIFHLLSRRKISEHRQLIHLSADFFLF
jgi:hypothetical protein